LILFLIYPLSNLLGDESPGTIAKITGTIANYLLPFFLYLFLFILLTDLLLLLNVVFKVFPFEKIKRRSFRLKAFFVIIFLSAIIVIAGVINFNSIRISEYNVDLQRKSSDLDSLKIAFISDFHLQENTPVRFVKQAVQKINKINPDLMLFGGDIVEGDGEDAYMKEFESLLGSIKAKYGVYGVLGNHEHYSRQDRGRFFNRAGIHTLIDSTVIFNRCFILAGRNDSHISTRKSLKELMSSLPDSLPVVLLDHRPSEIKQVSGTKADILLSGHTHNGQLFPINLITRKVYDLSMGYRKFGNTHFFVSSGIRLWGPPVRTTGKSEIMVINVSFTK
jgi:predicted MPP superfamily phosphohydrolase